MAENKTKKYYKYALGEILLVVVGILIALQISNWNENRIRSNNAAEFVVDFEKDLRKDTSIFGQEIRKIDRIMEYKKWILNLQNFDSIPIDFLEGIPQIGYHNIKINNGTIVRMRNSDVWNTSKYRKVFKRINNYYTFHQTYLNNLNEWEKKGAEKEFSFWNEQDVFEIRFSNLDSIPMIQKPRVRKENIVHLLTSINGRNYLKLSLMRENGMSKTYKIIYKEAKELLIDMGDIHQN